MSWTSKDCPKVPRDEMPEPSSPREAEAPPKAQYLQGWMHEQYEAGAAPPIATPSREPDAVREALALADDMIDPKGKTMKQWDEIRAQCLQYRGSDLPRLNFESLMEDISDAIKAALRAVPDGAAREPTLEQIDAALDAFFRSDIGLERRMKAALIAAALPPATPPSDDLEREARTGRHLLQTAKALGWPDSGEGCLEFMLRRAREVALEDCASDELPSDERARVVEVYGALFEPRESDAIDNLEGALRDIKRFSEAGKPTDAVCIRTLERIQKQLVEAHRALSPTNAPAAEGGR